MCCTPHGFRKQKFEFNSSLSLDLPVPFHPIPLRGHKMIWGRTPISRMLAAVKVIVMVCTFHSPVQPGNRLQGPVYSRHGSGCSSRAGKRLDARRGAVSQNAVGYTKGT